ncbi:MAG: 16S rRNA (adenine(1518)-N(6)/adenine(1519)-N(6))-dimethyltransferase [Flavobacteriales bacterium]|nr:16S rRNA (adenine(1518)-N(6)/adenine(1519)-N(6))-dimethyltransferase [Flavobacteriales bacterium]
MNSYAKKYLGQHFLIKKSISEKIVDSLDINQTQNIIEIGPGRGALTDFLITKTNHFTIIEIDLDCIKILEKKFQNIQIIHGDFLTVDLSKIGYLNYSIIGNFPYNISTQILFKVLENRNSVDQVVGMFQKEVAERICSKPNSKKYGILSVLIQAYFNCNLLFDVAPDNFQPKPKVYSSVLKLSRNKTKELDCNHGKFLTVVKAGFSQRRKKLKNALKKIINLEDTIKYNIMNKRAEELSVNEFIKLTNLIFPKS